MATASPAKFPEAVEKSIPMKENSTKLQQADPTASKVEQGEQRSCIEFGQRGEGGGREGKGCRGWGRREGG